MMSAAGKKIIFFLILSMLCCLHVIAAQEHKTGNRKDSERRHPPRFSDYSVDTFLGKPAPVKIPRHTEAMTFRTQIRRGARKGPNFAGHYTIATWACGSNCMALAIINAKTGRVFSPPSPFEVHFTRPDQEPIQFRQDSKLLIVIGSPFGEADKERPVGRYYYKWADDKLRRIYSEIIKEP